MGNAKVIWVGRIEEISNELVIVSLGSQNAILLDVVIKGRSWKKAQCFGVALHEPIHGFKVAESKA